VETVEGHERELGQERDGLKPSDEAEIVELGEWP
jgi:hypothetical protein